MTAGLEIEERGGGVVLLVKVVPGASRERVVGHHAGGLKVAVAAPAEGGKANAAVCALLARVLGVRKSDVSVASGLSSPVKRIRIERLTRVAAAAALTTALGGAARKTAR